MRIISKKVVHICATRKSFARNADAESKTQAASRPLVQNAGSKTPRGFQSDVNSDESKIQATARSIALKSARIIQATSTTSPPPLPNFPYPNPDPPLFFRVRAGRKAATFVEVAVKCNALSSPSDTPSLGVVLRCFPVHPIRISDVTFSLAFDRNEVLQLSPTEISGPETEVNTSLSENKSIALQAGAAVAGNQRYRYLESRRTGDNVCNLPYSNSPTRCHSRREHCALVIDGEHCCKKWIATGD